MSAKADISASVGSIVGDVLNFEFGKYNGVNFTAKVDASGDATFAIAQLTGRLLFINYEAIGTVAGTGTPTFTDLNTGAVFTDVTDIIPGTGGQVVSPSSNTQSTIVFTGGATLVLAGLGASESVRITIWVESR